MGAPGRPRAKLEWGAGSPAAGSELTWSQTGNPTR